MANLAIIPARGGSKRIPKKNIKLFHNKPIIEYTITTLKNSNLFDEVMVSTDDLEIKNIAETLGAKVPFLRNEESANDFATLSQVILEVLSMYKQQGKQFEHVCCMLPTAALILPSKIKEGFDLLKNKNLRFIINAQCNAVKNIFKLKKIPFRQITFNKKNEDELGEIFTFFVLETILLSRLMNINPFDQPAVEQVKIETKKILS